MQILLVASQIDDRIADKLARARDTSPARRD